MQQVAHGRRMTKRTAVAILLAVVGMLAIGGAWSSASADQGGVPNGGANQPGPYDPGDVCGGTNQGNSQNCNGSVGNADDKNPPGQVNNEHDNGYECDGNKGVGDKGGNPAHTGCDTTTTTTHSQGCTTEQCDGCTSNCGGSSDCTNDCGGLTPTPETPGAQPSAEVLGLTEERPPDAAAPAAVQAKELAFTGSRAETMGFLALALFAFGGSAILFARREEQQVLA